MKKLENLLEIQSLSLQQEGRTVLDKIDLTVRKGEVHVIMGPNGAGKSSLSKVLAGHPAYNPQGKAFFKGQSLFELSPEERVYLGLFVSFQYPLEISGISNRHFLFTSCNAVRKGRKETLLSDSAFDAFLEEKMALLEMKKEFKERDLNEGFSGGEKKRNEILQMAVLDPDLSILDEVDSGLDIDALKTVSKAINLLVTPEKSLILITHYQRLLDYIRPDYVHILIGGKILCSGGPELALELEQKGYEWVVAKKTTEEIVL